MNRDTELEVIKALAYGEEIESIANMAEVGVEEIELIKKEHADEICDRHREIMEAGKYGN